MCVRCVRWFPATYAELFSTTGRISVLVENVLSWHVGRCQNQVPAHRDGLSPVQQIRERRATLTGPPKGLAEDPPCWSIIGDRSTMAGKGSETAFILEVHCGNRSEKPGEVAADPLRGILETFPHYFQVVGAPERKCTNSKTYNQPGYSQSFSAYYSSIYVLTVANARYAHVRRVVYRVRL